MKKIMLPEHGPQNGCLLSGHSCGHKWGGGGGGVNGSQRGLMGLIGGQVGRFLQAPVC